MEMEEIQLTDNNHHHHDGLLPPPPPTHHDADADADASNHRDTVTEIETTQEVENQQQQQHTNDNDNNNDDVSSEREQQKQVTQILQLIASTGKFWHDWDKLKSMLSFQLKQVLSEYAEAKMTSEEQYASLGESYSELVKKLDEEITCFIEGPPFTLQRICEILLDAKSIYPNLSKLALALEKNLLVTSTLTVSADPYLQTKVQEPDDQENSSEKQKQESDSAQNGVDPVEADKDEVMVEADVSDDMTVDTEAVEDVNKSSSETNSEPNANNA
ncbi:hypothetical protein RIF29_32626 [Crotalaria pallida]|uniref:Serine/threonine-protein phosphatase 4 regulatory subunit 2 n=1 Tax=Crotalaria pallida TaxID=3830 RepID=A0AAN9HXT3_CROPI